MLDAWLEPTLSLVEKRVLQGNKEVAAMSEVVSACRRWALAALAAALAAGAVALWLSTAPPGEAASAEQTQSLQATVVSSVTWGSQGDCVQDMGAVDFGEVVQGGAWAGGSSVGCVTAGSPVSVTAVGTTPMTSASGSVFSFAYVLIIPAGDVPGTRGGEGTLDQPVALFTGAPAGTSRFDYWYNAYPPAGQPIGTYTGGVVTFTAST